MTRLDWSECCYCNTPQYALCNTLCKSHSTTRPATHPATQTATPTATPTATHRQNCVASHITQIEGSECCCNAHCNTHMCRCNAHCNTQRVCGASTLVYAFRHLANTCLCICVLRRVAVCCSVLHCVTVCCSVYAFRHLANTCLWGGYD